MRSLPIFATMMAVASTGAYAQTAAAPASPTPESWLKIAGNVRAETLRSAYNLSPAEAAKRADLEETAIAIAGELQRKFPQDYAGTFVDQEPVYQVRIAFSRDVSPAEILPLVDPKLRSFIKIVRVRESREERIKALRETAAALRASGLPFQLRYDDVNDGIDIGLPDTGLQEKARGIVQGRWGERVRFSKGRPMRPQQYATPTGIRAGDETQGGWYLFRQDNAATSAYSSTNPSGYRSRGMCTFAFNGRNSYGQTITTTAGHCVDDTLKNYTSTNGRMLELPTELARPFRIDPYYDYAHINIHGLTAGPWVWLIPNAEPWRQYAGHFAGSADPNPFVQGIINSAPYAVSGNYVKVTGSRAYYEHVVGTTVCKQGSITGFTCMIIRNDNYYDDAVDGFVETYNSRQAYPGASGDSGGPVFTPPDASGNVKAVGIFSAALDLNNPNNPGPCRTTSTSYCTQSYMPVDRINDQRPMQILIYPSGTVDPR